MSKNPEPSIEIESLGKSEKQINEEYIKESEKFLEERKKSKEEEQEKLEKITEEKFEEHQNAEQAEEDIRQEIKTMLDEDEDKVIMIEKYRNLLKAKKESEIALTEYMLAAPKSDPELKKECGITEDDRRKLGPSELLDKAVKQRKKVLGEE